MKRISFISGKGLKIGDINAIFFKLKNVFRTNGMEKNSFFL